MCIGTSTALPSTRSLDPLSVFLVSPPSEFDAKYKKKYFLWACVAIFLACLLASARLPLPELASGSACLHPARTSPFALRACMLAPRTLAGPQRRSLACPSLPLLTSAHVWPLLASCTRRASRSPSAAFRALCCSPQPSHLVLATGICLLPWRTGPHGKESPGAGRFDLGES